MTEKRNLKPGELVDPFTGAVFTPCVEDHYEPVDPVPHAPPVTTPRLSLRERVERLLAGGVDLSQGIYDEEDDGDLVDDDDDQEPLTKAEFLEVARMEAYDRLAAIGQQKAAEAAQAQAAPPPSASPAPPPTGAPNPPADGPNPPQPTGSKSP